MEYYLLLLKERSSDYPVREKYCREEFFKNLEENLKSGFIAEKDYQHYVKEATIYAEIVD